MALFKEVLIVGCGLTGAVIARELAQKGYLVIILERRNHIGGNMYDYYDKYGIPIHKYGPHTFHTNDLNLLFYIEKYLKWNEYKVYCGAEINKKCTPTPFNFKTIDDFYTKEKAINLKEKLNTYFKGRETATVLEILVSECPEIREFGKFLFDHDYSLYTAKQWGISPKEIDSSVLKRVPIRLGYEEGYFTDIIQVMPDTLYTHFFENLLNHENIKIKLDTDALKLINIKDGVLYIDDKKVDFPVIYTGALDELFNCEYGKLPYRSLEFKIKHTNDLSYQPYSIVAYPEAKDYTRIVEFKKMYSHLQCIGSTYVIEYPKPYAKEKHNEPYYPVPTQESAALYQKYLSRANKIKHLFPCGRLGDFKYYNMDETLKRALSLVETIFN